MPRFLVHLPLSKRMMKDENANDESHVLAMEDFERGRNQTKKHDNLKRRTRSQSKPRQ